MADSDRQTQRPPPSNAEREAKLAAALRANLRRRKALPAEKAETSRD